MYTAIRATTQTLVHFLLEGLRADPHLRPLFIAGGGMDVSPNTPAEMVDLGQQGLSVWLYRVERDDERLNAPPEYVAPDLLRRAPLPLRLHYLMTPITNPRQTGGSETEQEVLGKVMQLLHERGTLRGADLRHDLAGTDAELHARLETLGVQDLTQVWDALEGSYQLCVSYEIGLVNIQVQTEPVRASPVLVAMPDYGLVVSADPA